MTDELKPVRCGCGGEATLCIGVSPYATIIRNNHEEPVAEYNVLCDKCGIRTMTYYSKDEAITAWNAAMSGVVVAKNATTVATDINVRDKFAEDINVPGKDHNVQDCAKNAQ